MIPHPLPDIDPRGFVYRPTPAHYGMLAADLHGTARDQWKWWYRKQRMQRAGRADIIGEIGHIEGMRIFTGMDRPAESITVGLGHNNAALFLRLMADSAALSLSMSLVSDPLSFDADRVREPMIRNFHLPEVPVPKLTPRHRDRPAHERIAAQRGRHQQPPRRR